MFKIKLLPPFASEYDSRAYLVPSSQTIGTKGIALIMAKAGDDLPLELIRKRIKVKTGNPTIRVTEEEAKKINGFHNKSSMRLRVHEDFLDDCYIDKAVKGFFKWYIKRTINRGKVVRKMIPIINNKKRPPRPKGMGLPIIRRKKR